MSQSRSEKFDYMDVDDFEELLADMPNHERWELIVGRVMKMMIGAWWQHDLIIQNLAFGLRERFRSDGCACRTFTETFYLKAPLLQTPTLPDVIVRCGPLSPDATSLHDSKVLIEVLSPDSETRDSVEKWRSYRELTSLERYVLIERDRNSIDVFDRSGAVWAVRRTIEGLDAVLDLPAVNVSVPLAEVYQDVL